MMIRDKIICCARPILLIVFSILLGCASAKGAQGMDFVDLMAILNDPTKEVKISDMLTGKQVDALKALKEVKDIKSAKRKEMRITTANVVSKGDIVKGSLQEKLKDTVQTIVGKGGIGGILGGITNETNHLNSFSDPSNLNGLAVRFAPSDKELFEPSE